VLDGIGSVEQLHDAPSDVITAQDLTVTGVLAQ